MHRFQTDAALGETWSAAHLVMASAMVIGGAAGSTAGGIKIIRTISMATGALYQATDVFYPED